MVKSCQNCLDKIGEPFGICKKYREAMTRHDYWGKDFIRELTRLARKLAEGCPDYKKKGKEAS